MKNLVLLFITIFLIGLLDAHAVFTDGQNSNFHVINEWSNGGGEFGKTNWSETGSGTLSTDTSTKLRGKASIKFVSAGSSDYVSTSGVSCKQGPNCLARFWYKTTSSNLTATIYDGSSNLIATLPLTSNTEFTKAELSFIAATPTTLYSLRITDGNAGADTIYIDNGYLGANDNIGSVNLNSKEYDISSYLSASPSISTVHAAYAVVTKTRDGTWWLKAQITYGASSANTAHAITFSGVNFATNGGGNNQTCAVFYPSSTSSNCYINSNSSTINVSVGASVTIINFFFDAKLNSKPTWAIDYSNEQVVSASVANQYAGINFNSGSCSFASTAGSYTVFNAGGCSGTLKGIATNGTAGNSEFVVSGLLPGDYRLDFGGILYADSGTNCSYDIYDGTNSLGSVYLAGPIYGQGVFGVVNYSAIQASTTYQIRGNRVSGGGSCRIYCNGGGNQCTFTINQIAPRVAIPQITNNLVTDYLGQSTVAAVNVGQSGNQSAVCSSSPCGIFQNIGNSISSVTRSSNGSYTVNFATGAFSQSPICTCSVRSGGGSDQICTVVVSSSTSTNILTRDNAGSPTDGNPSIICVGTK